MNDDRQESSANSSKVADAVISGTQSSFIVPDSILQKWQHLVDLMAEIVGVPAGLIMRLVEEDIQVLVASRTEGNPYHPSHSEKLFGSGLYCEAVIKNRSELLVPDAFASERWKDNPDTKLNMISYLGFPVQWPDGSPFGTICVLDSKENAYSEKYKRLIAEFRDMVWNPPEAVFSRSRWRRLAQISCRVWTFLTEMVLICRCPAGAFLAANLRARAAAGGCS